MLADKYDPNWRDLGEIPASATVEDFVSYLPGNSYMYLPTGQEWLAKPVNAFLPKQQVKDKWVKATDWLDKFRCVQSKTWVPGEPELIPDRIARAEGGWVEKPDTMALNKYRAPAQVAGDASRAGRWINHIHKLYPEYAEHLINWFAHRVQHPGDKCNHGLIIGGEQGIGKDMILKPVRQAVGAWNYKNISPDASMSSFNEHVRSVICQIDEARDLGETNQWKFYEHLKTLTTAPPDIIQCNEKHVSPYGVTNCTGIIITTNHRTSGIYLPPTDRRFYVAWSTRTREEFGPSYFNDLESFYVNGGYGHVAAYLREHSLKGWNAKTAPPQTSAWKDIVGANLPQEDADFAFAIEQAGSPDALTVKQTLWKYLTNEVTKWLEDRRNTRLIAHRLESCGYVAVRNNEDGTANRWQYMTNGKVREVSIYAKSILSVPARLTAARSLVRKLQQDSSDF